MMAEVRTGANRWLSRLRELPRLVKQVDANTNFHYAFFFLPAARRQALRDVYAYCRLIDDIVDGPGKTDDKAAELSTWRRELFDAFHDGKPAHPIARRLQQSQQLFGLRYEDALAVLAGCEMDLHKTRYATWDETYNYCYHVASSVGLLCIELFGCKDPRSRQYAIHLGRALQLTNIMRDIAEDADRDRVYLPSELLREFGLSDLDIMSGQLSRDGEARAARLLSAVARRTREEYRLARAARSDVDRKALLPAEIMGRVYFSLLLEIERRGPAVLKKKERIALPRRKKVTAALAAIAGSLLPL
jgi:phytoene synthase